MYAVTRSGVRLGGRLVQALDGTLFLPSRLADEFGAVGFESLPACVAKTFQAFDGHVFVCAAGIAVRAIAAHLQSKTRDPAVVVLDDAGRFAVSLLSGHLGGANDLALAVSAAVGATPVVTTATDLAGVPAVDLLAKRRGLSIADASRIKCVSATLLEGRKVALFDPEDRLGAQDDPALAEYFEHLADPSLLEPGQPAVWVHWKRPSRRLLADGQGPGLLALHPRALAAGIGCRRGTETDEILTALATTMDRTGLAMDSLGCLASIDLKADEPGLLEAARELGLPLLTYAKSRLSAVTVPNPSQRVRDRIGVGSVAEASALLAAEPGRLLVPKAILGRVTVAVALHQDQDQAQDQAQEKTWPS